MMKAIIAVVMLTLTVSGCASINSSGQGCFLGYCGDPGVNLCKDGTTNC